MQFICPTHKRFLKLISWSVYRIGHTRMPRTQLIRHPKRIVCARCALYRSRSAIVGIWHANAESMRHYKRSTMFARTNERTEENLIYLVSNWSVIKEGNASFAHHSILSYWNVYNVPNWILCVWVCVCDVQRSALRRDAAHFMNGISTSIRALMHIDHLPAMRSHFIYSH